MVHRAGINRLSLYKDRVNQYPAEGIYLMEQAYAAIGRAVIAMQMFEVAFVTIHEGFKMITDPAYLRVTGGMIDEKRYKIATSNVVKILSARGQIAPDLEARLNTLIDRRNELMHRWFLHHGWPGNGNNDPDSYAEVIRLAQLVHSEANAITLMLVEYVVKQASYEQHQVNPGAVENAIAGVFHQLPPQL